jgi:hypothetical protein
MWVSSLGFRWSLGRLGGCVSRSSDNTKSELASGHLDQNHAAADNFSVGIDVKPGAFKSL